MESSALAVMEQLFLNGPTWDGNVISKTGRDILLELGFIERDNGWQWLNREGVRYATSVDVTKFADIRWLIS